MVVLEAPRNLQNDVAAWICVGGVGLFLIWVLTVIVLQLTEIRPKEITEKDIVLTGVSEGFIAALDELDMERDAWRKRILRDLEEEEEDLPPRRQPSDAIQVHESPGSNRSPDAIEE
jgi:hypothetical protein